MHSPDRPLTIRASRAADPHLVAGRDRRARHRPLRLCAGAAGHARFPALVVFGRGLHEHHQRRRLSRRRADGITADQAIRLVGRGALGNAGLPRLACDLRDDRQFRRAQSCAADRRICRRGRLRRRWCAGGNDCPVTARTREFSFEPVLRRTRTRHSRLRPDRALCAAGIRPRFVVDRVVGADAARRRDDRAAAARSVREQGRPSPTLRKHTFRFRKSRSICSAISCSAPATSPT